MEYTTLSAPLILPDYGRNVQHMVEHAVTLPLKEDRQRCAATIIKTMTQLHPELNNEQQQHIYYDHLALMSGFRLDIDYPFGNPQPEDMKPHPQPLQAAGNKPFMRHYGRIVQNMVNEAVAQQNSEQQKYLILRIAQRMRQCYYVSNKEIVDAQQVKCDIAVLSNNTLDCNFPEFDKLFTEQIFVSNKRKKKK